MKIGARTVVVNTKIKTIKLIEDEASEYSLDDCKVTKHFLNRERKVPTKEKTLINWTMLKLGTYFP